MGEGSNTMQLDDSCAPLVWIGATSRESPPPPVHTFSLTPLNSVRTKVKNFEDEDHYFAKDYYARCLYLGENGDPKDVRAGFLKSSLLIKVILIQPPEF